jgi:hypothetical protein
MPVRVAAATIVVVVAAGCARFAPGEPSRPLYTVTASVMQRPVEMPVACSAIPLPYPPIGCGGVAVRGIDLGTMPGVVTYRNGVRATGTLRMVGSWDGHVLNLARAPENARTGDATPLPTCAYAPGRSSADPEPPVMQEVMHDDAYLRAQGIQLLEFGPCRDSMFFVVPVADSKTVELLTRRYGQAEIAGWLQPVT